MPIQRLLSDGGVSEARIEAELSSQPLTSADDWWTIVIGSGFVSTVERMGPAVAERVRAANLRSLSAMQVTGVKTSSIYSVARKPAP
jgi:hypothetical protein